MNDHATHETSASASLSAGGIPLVDRTDGRDHSRHLVDRRSGSYLASSWALRMGQPGGEWVGIASLLTPAAELDISGPL